MSFDWSTFILEIINFLILVWILKRFFYKPVREAIDRRQKAIEKTITDAKTLQAEAENLKDRYETRMADWEKERQEARRKLQDELTAERNNQMDALQKSLAEEKKKNKVLEEKHAAEVMQEAERTAMNQAMQFSARMLQRVADASLNTCMVGIFIEDLRILSGESLEKLKETCASSPKVSIVSAFPLDKKQQDAVIEALHEVTGQHLSCAFSVDPTVIAGLRVNIGAYALQANICDELRFFAQVAHEAA